ncbi:MAG TPA: phage resistance protein, partial [Gemmataceae bacterium]
MSQTNQPPLLREVIRIPERVSPSDFVLKLAEGVADAEATLREYVLTDRLVANFDHALGLIQSALASGTSKAAYLHGSFGAGKSHFMAVLHALLRGEPAARARDEFAGLLAKHDGWLAGRRFLLVPYHLLGAKSLEQRVLGGYAEYVRKLHPEAPVPAVHRTDTLLENARHLRAQVGSARFLELLGGPEQEDEWGEPERFWTAGKLDAALAAPHGDPLRRRLVSDLLLHVFPGFAKDALEDEKAYVSLDRGLAEISGHAKGLGYDALVLFLDELILWLASSIGDQQFVSREVQKITNFVEGGDARRPLPVISFIARQRDLRELVGEEVTGAVELSFQDTLNLASGRFDVITLEDRNLPVIARERLLRPVSAEAARKVQEAFERTTKVRPEVWDTLLGTGRTTGADREAFRATYPFPPAFMDTLVHVSSALQRSRTALRLMLQILVDRRDELRLGQLIPLGDLYDAISRGGDQPFTEKLKVEFETAQRLYQTKLRPYLLETHGLTEDDVDRARHGQAADGQLAARVRAFTSDDRLLKTLLLSALAPTVPALQNLTVRRLAALNHGSITSPIPGGEVRQVAQKVEEWAARFGEIKFIPGDDPGVALELVGVDVDSVLQAATALDSEGARRQLVKRLLCEQLGVTSTDQFSDRAEVT